MKCMCCLCQTWVHAQTLCLNLRSCFLHSTKSCGNCSVLPPWNLYPARCLYRERELYIYFCKFLSVFLTLFPQLSLAKLPRCHFQDCPVSYFLLAERRYSSVLFYISSGPDIFDYERGKKRIMKSTLLKCLWLPHNDSLIEHLVLRRVFAL